MLKSHVRHHIPDVCTTKKIAARYLFFICHELRRIVSQYDAVSMKDGTARNLDVSTAKKRVFSPLLKTRRCNIFSIGHKTLVLTFSIGSNLQLPYLATKTGIHN